MPKEVKKTNVKFDNIFVKDTPRPKRASSILEILDDYIYETFNKSKEEQEAKYGGKLTPSFHPSQLGKAFCVRKLVYEYIGAPFDEDLKFASSLTHRTWHNGHKVHDRIQEYLADLNAFTKGKCVLIGRWKCARCQAEYGYKKSGKKHESEYWIPRPDKCKCGAHPRNLIYMEAGISIPNLRVKGKMDGVLEWKGERWIIEIKSMNPFQFAKLNGPPEYYIPQSEIYMLASGIHKTIWIYEDKATQVWRDFVTQHDYKKIEKIMKLVESANKAIDGEKLPKRYHDKRSCRACEFRKVCESDKAYKDLIAA